MEYTHPIHRHVEVYELSLADSADMWWVRFDVSPCNRFFACGSRRNQIVVYDLQNLPHRRKVLPGVAKCDDTTRQVSITLGGHLVVGCSDLGAISLWVRQDPRQDPEASDSGDEHK